MRFHTMVWKNQTSTRIGTRLLMNPRAAPDDPLMTSDGTFSV